MQFAVCEAIMSEMLSNGCFMAFAIMATWNDSFDNNAFDISF